MNQELKQKLRVFADGYIACAQTYEGIDDEWVDYEGYCLNFHDNGEKLIVAVYPIVPTENGLVTQDCNNPVFENLLESGV
jgi:hypothetical protein